MSHLRDGDATLRRTSFDHDNHQPPGEHPFPDEVIAIRSFEFWILCDWPSKKVATGHIREGQFPG